MKGRKRVTDGVKLPRGIFERPTGSGIFWISYADALGRMKREKVGPKLGVAINVYHKRKNDIREGKQLPSNLRARTVPFAELARDFLEYSKIRHTPQSYQKNVQRMEVLLASFRDKAAAMITAQDLTRVLGAPEWAPATRNRYRALASGLYSLAVRNDKIMVNPAKKVSLWKENNARVRFLERREEDRLRRSIRKLAPEHEPEFDLALATGMRRGEQYALKWTAVDWLRKIVTVENSKNGERRHIPLNANAIAALKRMRAAGEKHAFVIPGPAKEEERVSDNRRWFERAVDGANIRNFHWHDLRHTFASRLVMAGTDIRTVQDLMGHKVIAMTVRYSHLSAPHKREAVETLERHKKDGSSTTTSTDERQEARTVIAQ